jgi:hypothetical protein
LDVEKAMQEKGCKGVKEYSDELDKQLMDTV